MTEAIEGRWWLDFTKRPPTYPGGNELILKAGEVTTAATGESFGTYQIEPGLLTITLRIPPNPGEGHWRMEAELMLSDADSPPAELPGVLRAIDAEEEVFSSARCRLIRRRANA